MQAQATPVKVKHGLAAGPAAAPQRADWTIDQGWDNYTPAQHAVWNFVEGMKNLPMSADEIPNFENLSEVLMRKTGWQVVAVAGLVPDDVFFEHLANRRFPAGNFIRGAHELDYLEVPINMQLSWGRANSPSWRASTGTR